MGAASRFPWQRWLLIFGLALSLAIAAFFTVRTVHNAPRSRNNEPIRAWMNVPYIAHAYQVPESILFQALGLPDNPRDKRPLITLALLQDRTSASMIAELDHTISQYRQQVSPTSSPSPHPVPGPP